MNSTIVMNRQQQQSNHKKNRSRILNDVILNCYKRSSYGETNDCTPLPLDVAVKSSSMNQDTIPHLLPKQSLLPSLSLFSVSTISQFKSKSKSIKEEDNDDTSPPPPPPPTLELKSNRSGSPTSAMNTFVFDQQEFNKDLLSTTVMLPDLFYDDYENENDYEDSPKYYYEDKYDDDEDHAEDTLMDTSTTSTDDASVVVDPCIVATVIHNANSYVDNDNDEGCDENNNIVCDDDIDDEEIEYLLSTTTATNKLIKVIKTNKEKKVNQMINKEKPIKKKINVKRNSYVSTKVPRPVLNVSPRGIGPITDPTENDVLCGRGGRINRHAGNVQFRDIIQSMTTEYLAPSTKKLEKAHIAASIVNDIRTMDPPGRFMKEDRGTGMWFDIGDAKAIKKTGQALREDAPDIRPATSSLDFDAMDIDMDMDDSSFLTVS